MGNIIIMKFETDIDNIFTYFEFLNCDSWEAFDLFKNIMIKKIGCKEMEGIDGIYSRYCFFEFDNLKFELFYHEDLGLGLCSKNKENNEYYNKLEKIAMLVSENISKWQESS